MTQPLFRPEVLEAKRGSWLGGISLALQEQERGADTGLRRADGHGAGHRRGGNASGQARQAAQAGPPRNRRVCLGPRGRECFNIGGGKGNA